jgi:type III pantothenate kinase
MLFCIDIGNTNIVLGVTRENQILHHWRIRTEKEITADELGILVGNFFQWEGLGFKDVKSTIVSCVVPPLLNTVEEFSRRYFHVEPVIVGPGLKTGMPIKYDNPREVGADRIVNAVAAYEKYKTALIVVDFGTATTFDYISRKGDYMGGAIAPGVIISCEALFQEASKLPTGGNLFKTGLRHRQGYHQQHECRHYLRIRGTGGRHCEPHETGVGRRRPRLSPRAVWRP